MVTCEVGCHLLSSLRQTQALLQGAIGIHVLPALEVAGHCHLDVLGAHPFHDLGRNHRVRTKRSGEEDCGLRAASVPN